MALIGVRRALIKPKIVAAAVATTTLDPSFKGANVTLSNGNLTATASSTANSTTRSIASHASGKYYFEFTVGAAVNSAVGEANSGSLTTEYLGQANVRSMGAYGSGGWTGGGGTTTAPAWVSGHVYAAATDITNKAMWIKDLTAGGLWNANATADPATNVNGTTFSAQGPSPPFYAATITGNSGDTITFNFGATAYIGTPPSGFSNW